jgi:hypothetical protein
MMTSSLESLFESIDKQLNDNVNIVKKSILFEQLANAIEKRTDNNELDNILKVYNFDND